MSGRRSPVRDFLNFRGDPLFVDAFLWGRIHGPPPAKVGVFFYHANPEPPPVELDVAFEKSRAARQSLAGPLFLLHVGAASVPSLSEGHLPPLMVARLSRILHFRLFGAQRECTCQSGTLLPIAIVVTFMVVLL